MGSIREDDVSDAPRPKPRTLHFTFHISHYTLHLLPIVFLQFREALQCLQWGHLLRTQAADFLFQKR